MRGRMDDSGFPGFVMRQRVWEEHEQVFVVVLAGRKRKGSAKV